MEEQCSAVVKTTKTKVLKPSLFETRDLIRLVKGKKCLWDRFDPDYRDRILKEAAWLEIYKAIEPDYIHFGEDMKNIIGSHITRKWYNVRDSFVKSKKGHGQRNKPYIYAKLLAFLEPVYFDDKGKADGNDNESVEAWMSEPSNWAKMVTDSDEPGSKKAQPDRRKTDKNLLKEREEVYVDDEEDRAPDAKRPRIDQERKEKEETMMGMLVNLLNREEEEDRAFFTSITPAVKKLSEESRMEFRIGVMNLLKKLQSKERDRSALVFKSENYEEDTNSE